MFLKKFDYISPQTTLYYHKRDRHVNLISGILTLISYALLFACSVYFLTLLFNRKDPTAYFFNKFEDDIGTFKMDSFGMFHYVTVGKRGIDFKAVNVVGVSRYISYYQANQNLSKMEHWIYGPCEDDDAEGVKDLIENYTSFKEGACVKHYWNITEMKYYTKGEDGFAYPEIRHGASHPKANTFGVIIEKCRNESIFNNGQCYDNEKISSYVLQSISLAFYIVDHYIDVGIYKSPATAFFYKITNGIIETTFSSNQLNFNPALIKTHNGFLFDNTIQHYSYIFDQNAKSTIKTETSGILCTFYLWMQNRVQVYERTYKRIQDTCASIGGMTKLILISAKILNYFLSGYTIYIDTDKLYIKYATGKISYNPKLKVLSGNDSSKLQLNNKSDSENKDSLLVTNRVQNKNTEKITIGKIEETPNIKKRRRKEEMTFIEYVYYRVFGKISKNEKTAKNIMMMFNLRTMILSEEFLFENYITSKRIGCNYSENGIPLATRKSSNNMFRLDFHKGTLHKNSTTILI